LTTPYLPGKRIPEQQKKFEGERKKQGGKTRCAFLVKHVVPKKGGRRNVIMGG